MFSYFFRLKGWNYCKRISWDLTPFLHGCQVCGDGNLLRSFWEHFLGWYFYIDLEMLGGFWSMDWLLDWRIVGETTMQFGSFQIDDSDSRSLLLHRNCLWTFALSYGEHAEPVMMGLLGSSASFFEGTRLQGPRKKRTPGEIVTCHTPSLTGWSWSTVLTAGCMENAEVLLEKTRQRPTSCMKLPYLGGLKVMKIHDMTTTWFDLRQTGYPRWTKPLKAAGRRAFMHIICKQFRR